MFSGSIVAIATPMYPDGKIDYASFEKLINFHIENKTDAIVVAGTTGESATLDYDEHRELIRKAVEFADNRIPIIAGTGANSTLEALKLTNWAAEDGAQACLLVAPYYNKPTQEGLYQHYKLIAETVDIPQILYNVPGRCGCDIELETVERLTEFKNIIGIKEATNLERVKELVEKVGHKIAIYTGEDAIAAECILAGAKGVISVSANVVPLEMHQMTKAALEGDRNAAISVNQMIEDVHRLMFVESNPIPVKWALKEMNKIQSGIRLPLVPLSEKYREDVKEMVAKIVNR